MLHVTETWTNADGSTGSAVVADNVEAYAPGSPIFALSGDDHLTGGGANDLFVFAQPIGNDTIYNFNTASDKIDLVTFTGFTSFGDIQAHTADDANGNAVITLGDGETITLHGVNAASLTAADFVFNQTPVVENDGAMAVSDGAMLPLDGTINNVGSIGLNSSGHPTELQIIGDGITLQGGGEITLSDNSANIIVGTTAASTLTNVDNIISGAGQIGASDSNLTLVNEAHGTIDANIADTPLVLETGNTVINSGTLEATNGGSLQINDAVNNAGGTIEAASGSTVDIHGAINGGSATVAGGALEFDGASSVSITFDNGHNGTTYGALVLGNPAEFSGPIVGFAGTAPDVAHSDSIDLVGINYNSGDFSESYNATTGQLAVTDGSHGANLTFDNFDGTLDFASDGKGGTLITDPPATAGTIADGGTGEPHDGSNHASTTFDGFLEKLNLADNGSSAGEPTADSPSSGAPSLQSTDVSANGGLDGMHHDHDGFVGSGQAQLVHNGLVGPEQTPSDSNGTAGPDQQHTSPSNEKWASLGTSGTDNFLFHPNIGAQSEANPDSHTEVNDLGSHPDIEAAEHLASLITPDLHSQALAEAQHDVQGGVNADQWHQMMANFAHLH